MIQDYTFITESALLLDRAMRHARLSTIQILCGDDELYGSQPVNRTQSSSADSLCKAT